MSTPLGPTTWVGIEVDPSSLGFGETVEAHFAYQSATRDYPKVLSVTNRIGLARADRAAVSVPRGRLWTEGVADAVESILRLRDQEAATLLLTDIMLLAPEGLS